MGEVKFGTIKTDPYVEKIFAYLSKHGFIKRYSNVAKEFGDTNGAKYKEAAEKLLAAGDLQRGEYHGNKGVICPTEKGEKKVKATPEALKLFEGSGINPKEMAVNILKSRRSDEHKQGEIINMALKLAMSPGFYEKFMNTELGKEISRGVHETTGEPKNKKWKKTKNINTKGDYDY